MIHYCFNGYFYDLGVQPAAASMLVATQLTELLSMLLEMPVPVIGMTCGYIQGSGPAMQTMDGASVEVALRTASTFGFS